MSSCCWSKPIQLLVLAQKMLQQVNIRPTKNLPGSWPSSDAYSRLFHSAPPEVGRLQCLGHRQLTTPHALYHECSRLETFYLGDQHFLETPFSEAHT